MLDLTLRSIQNELWEIAKTLQKKKRTFQSIFIVFIGYRTGLFVFDALGNQTTKNKTAN